MGLIRTPGEEHGIEGRLLCEEYFKDVNPGIRKPAGESFGFILHAIEHHDDKSLKTGVNAVSPGNVPDLLNLLSTSDDMDAFGKMGIYRYAEIYLLRGIQPESLPARVNQNVKQRFENLERFFMSFPDFTNAQERRYQEVFNFYSALAQAYASYLEKPGWEPILINLFQQSLELKLNLGLRDRILPDGFDKSGANFIEKIQNWFSLLDLENPDSDQTIL